MATKMFEIDLKYTLERVELGLGESLLAPTSTAGWVSCNEEMTVVNCHCNFIIWR